MKDLYCAIGLLLVATFFAESVVMEPEFYNWFAAITSIILGFFMIACLNSFLEDKTTK